MPHINAAAALQICVLLTALPAQYFISQWYGTDSAQRIQITERLIIASWRSFTKSCLSLDAWADRLKLWLSKTRNWYYGEKKTKIGDNEAETHSYFAESTHVRSPKPEYIQFSVGQVIVHKRFGYSGVIVGWDVKAKAPEGWLQHKYSPAKQDLKDTPHYRILINKANGFGKSTAYIPEEEITIIMGLEGKPPKELCKLGWPEDSPRSLETVPLHIKDPPQPMGPKQFGRSLFYVGEAFVPVLVSVLATDCNVHHPDMKAYFSGYDGSKYIMQPWLKKIYPHD